MGMSTAGREDLIWLDGEMVSWDEANVHVLTHSLHYGVGVFEGVRVYETERGAAIFRLHEHVDRLFRSAQILNMAAPYSREVLAQAHKRVIKKNRLKSAYIRSLFYYGAESLGMRTDPLKVHAVVAAWEWPAYQPPQSREAGIRVRTSSYCRHHGGSSLCKAKICGYYVTSILALQEALASGSDEALLLDGEGYVAEGSGENIFMVADGVIHTPDTAVCLAGITSDTVKQFASDLGIDVRERRITRDELYLADEVFFTGTTAEVLPVRELDGRTIGSGRRGPITEQLQSLYRDQVMGRRKAYPDWLSHC